MLLVPQGCPELGEQNHEPPLHTFCGSAWLAVWLLPRGPYRLTEWHHNVGKVARAGAMGTSDSTPVAASTLSATQGYGLDTRFTGSGFNRFMTGSTDHGRDHGRSRSRHVGRLRRALNSQMGGQTGGQNGFGNLGDMGGMSGMGGYGMGNMMGFRNMFGKDSQQTGPAAGQAPHPHAIGL